MLEGADPNRKIDTLADIKRRVAAMEPGFNLNYLTMRYAYIGWLTNQEKLSRLLDPRAEALRTREYDARATEIYRKNNRWLMQGWALVSTAPHPYLMALCGAFDYQEAYFWLRLVGMNLLFVALVLWQRR